MDGKLAALVAKMVRQGELPQRLFRYRTINPHFDDILIKNELWFSKGTQFNDPFDCNIEIDTNNTTDEIRQFILRVLPGIPSDEIDSLVRTASDPDAFHKMVNNSARKVLEKWGIVCFSKVNDNVLLWSHYSDYHRGCILTFDVLEDPDYFVFPVNVIYQTNYPDYNHLHLKNPGDLVKKLIGTKSLDWEYEHEVRVVKNSLGANKFKKNSLVEIIFGWRTDDPEIARIQNLAKGNNYNHVVFKQARLKKKQFGIEIVSL